ncbi:MAG: glycosyltransferase family protein [Acidobacteria bacterium]|nr:glycosyltransferase family protein [Acidobacteriota bacterium]
MLTAIVQARMGSTRLPGKVLRPLAGRPMLLRIVQRARACPAIANVVVATSDLDGDAPIRRLCEAERIDCFAGSEQDVLDRFYQAARSFHGDPLVRITADCPLVDPGLLARLVALYQSGAYDHVGVATGAGALFVGQGRYPDGLDAECFSMAALERAWREATSAPDREHVTPYIWRHRDLFRCGQLTSDVDYSRLRWTVDNEADFSLIERLYDALYRPDRAFGMEDVLQYLATHPELAATNESFIGKEGYLEVWQGSEKKT